MLQSLQGRGSLNRPRTNWLKCALSSLRPCAGVTASHVSTFLSIIHAASKGKAAHLLKGSSKKKRSRAEIEEVKDEEVQLNKNR